MTTGAATIHSPNTARGMSRIPRCNRIPMTEVTAVAQTAVGTATLRSARNSNTNSLDGQTKTARVLGRFAEQVDQNWKGDRAAAHRRRARHQRPADHDDSHGPVLPNQRPIIENHDRDDPGHKPADDQKPPEPE